MTYTCGIFIIDIKGRVLLCHITNQPMDGRTWSIPKGLPDDGEHWDDAAAREVMEETSIRVDPRKITALDLSPYYSKSMSVNKTLVPFVYFLNVDGDTIECKCESMFFDKKAQCEKPEVDDFRWVALEDAKTMIHDSQAARLVDAFERHRSRMFDYKKAKSIADDFFPLMNPDSRHVLDENWDAHHEVIDRITDMTRRSLIVVIRESNNEQYEDYFEWNDRVYEVDTNKTEDELLGEWRAHVCSQMEINGITVNPTYVKIIMEMSRVKDEKLHKKIMRENEFCSWLEKNYITRRLTFISIKP